MARIIGIAGSLRRGSYNAALLRATRELAPADAPVEIATIASTPLYDGYLESEQGIPDPVAKLKETIAAAGLLLVTPEYKLADERIRKLLAVFMAGFAAFVSR